MRAHPRSRGENRPTVGDPQIPIGSSPLTRGKLDGELLGQVDDGLIPAHAGKTKSVIMTGIARAAHPRSRGENGMSARVCHMREGSSPLTRGKPHRPEDPRQGRRLIPAHAGKTVLATQLRICAWAHPRSRGENSASARTWRSAAGSSPLTRGKRAGLNSPPHPTRLIPAHAGKTSQKGHLTCPRQAHPRSRGENLVDAHVCRRYHGSSPLTRGKLHICDKRINRRRLIPAHAGKTRSSSRTNSPPRAHPRSRGENTS